MTSARASGDDAGCVLRIETGVAVVLTDAGPRRASYGGRMLARVARDPGCAPQAGDWVTVRVWGDGRSTLEDCLTPPRTAVAQEPGTAVVLPLRRRSAAR